MAEGEFAGVTRLPACAECEAAKKITAVAIPEPPPVISSTRGRPKPVKPEWQYYPNPQCPYYGWLKRGNLSSNGHPKGGPQRQWACSICKRVPCRAKSYPGHGGRGDRPALDPQRGVMI